MLITVIAINSTVLYTSNLLDWVDLFFSPQERGKEGGNVTMGSYGYIN